MSPTTSHNRPALSELSDLMPAAIADDLELDMLFQRGESVQDYIRDQLEKETDDGQNRDEEASPASGSP